MNGSRIQFNSRSVNNASARSFSGGAYNPRGSNLSPLSNAHYFSNIAQASGQGSGVLSPQFNSGPNAHPILPVIPSPSFNKQQQFNSITSSELGQLNSQQNVSSGVNTSGVNSAVGAISGVRSALLSAGGMAPVAAAAQLSQQIGQGISSSLRLDAASKIQDNFTANINRGGIASMANAESIRAGQNIQADKNQNAATIGSLFGPVGALAGHFISQASANAQRPSVTVNTFGGQIDPTDLGVRYSNSAAAPTGFSTMTDSLNG